MRQAVILAEDIKRLKRAVNKSNSFMLKNDYKKAIFRKTKELKDYCRFKNINYKEVVNGR